MKRSVLIGYALTVAVLVFAGCAGLSVSTGETGKAAQTLDRWLEKEAFPEVVKQIRTNTHIKGRPFIIVKPEGAQMSDQIDDLTAEIREKLINFLLKQQDIKLVAPHPVASIRRNYTIQKLRCGAFDEPERLLYIDIRLLENRTAAVSFRAMDPENGEWIPGFSIYSNVVLSLRQSDALQRPPRSDNTIKGLRNKPFESNEQDMLAASLAQNLTCIFKENYRGDQIRVHVANPRFGRLRSIATMLRSELNACKEIRQVINKTDADWVIELNRTTTGRGSGLIRLSADTFRREGAEFVSGMSTFAYYKGVGSGCDIEGRWEIVKLPERSPVGFIDINPDASGRVLGTVYGPDETFIRRGVLINCHGINVDWTYFLETEQRTVEVEGVLSEDGRQMAVRASFFPTGDGPENWELELGP